MARSSLYDLSSFLNCWFWRFKFPCAKTTECCIQKMRQAVVRVRKKHGSVVWATPVHAPARHVIRVPNGKGVLAVWSLIIFNFL